MNNSLSPFHFAGTIASSILTSQTALSARLVTTALWDQVIQLLAHEVPTLTRWD